MTTPCIEYTCKRSKRIMCNNGTTCFSSFFSCITMLSTWMGKKGENPFLIISARPYFKRSENDVSQTPAHPQTINSINNELQLYGQLTGFHIRSIRAESISDPSKYTERGKAPIKG